nr:glycosyltransferase [Meiothermus sp.]
MTARLTIPMAFSHSKGDIVTFLDADDEWFVDRLERVVEAFHSGAGRVGLVQHPLRVVSQHGVTLATRFPYFLESGWLLPKALAGENLGLATATGISLHAQVASLVFPLPDSFRSWADRLIADRAAFVTETLCLREVLGIYRQHGRNTTGYIGVATIEEAKSQVDKLKALSEEHKSFIRSWIPDADTSHLGKEAIGTALCFLSLISGEYLSYKKLRKLVNSKRAVLWYLLFLMPRPLGLHTYLLWRKSPLKLTSIVRTRAGK